MDKYMDIEAHYLDNFDSVISVKTVSEVEREFLVEYEVLAEKHSYFDNDDINQLRERFIKKRNQLDKIIEIEEQLTCNADYFDYTLAVASGVLCGLVDVFFVGDVDLKSVNKWSGEKVNSFVKDAAHFVTKKDYSSDENGLKKAIIDLENAFPIPADLATNDFGGGKQHHLRDFSHHPNLMGLLFSIITQFSGKAFGTDTAGNLICINIEDTTLIGKSISEKIMRGVVDWFFHMLSDIAGSRSTPGAGTGLPGPILSLLKMVSTNPIFANEDGVNELSKLISKAFNGTLFLEKDSTGKINKDSIIRIDFRTELGMIKQQVGSVILNDAIVRSFFLISRLIREIQDKEIRTFSNLNKINWQKCIPFGNRTIARMLSIATTTFTLVDVADAAIRSVEKSEGNMVVFAGQMLLRVNFPGVGRMVVAVGNDMLMGVKRQKVQGEMQKVFIEKLSSYTDLLSAERMHFDSIICWNVVDKINQIEKVFESSNNSENLNKATDQYLVQNNLDDQFSNFDEFIDFMINSDEDLII